MHFDTILKNLFQSSRLLESLTGSPIGEWLNVEIPQAQIKRLDLVAWLADGSLYHLELQSGNDADMPRRMWEYYLLLWKRYGIPPVQHLIYVGHRPPAMSAEIRHENLWFRYRLIDMREMDSEIHLLSPAIEDNLLAILCRLSDTRSAVRRILGRIARLPRRRRADAVSQLLVLSGLRKLDDLVEQEVAQMPVSLDIMENSFTKRIFLKGRAEGEQDGARSEARNLLARLLERRFGGLTKAARRKLNAADLVTLEDWSLRVLDARSLEEVLQSVPSGTHTPSSRR